MVVLISSSDTTVRAVCVLQDWIEGVLLVNMNALFVVGLTGVLGRGLTQACVGADENHAIEKRSCTC